LSSASTAFGFAMASPFLPAVEWSLATPPK